MNLGILFQFLSYLSPKYIGWFVNVIITQALIYFTETFVPVSSKEREATLGNGAHIYMNLPDSE